MPPQHSQIALSIETLLDLSEMTVEELTGRLRAAEDRYDDGDIVDKTGRLLLTEKDWLARSRQ